MKELLKKHKRYLLTGVFHVIPPNARGGILIAMLLAYCFQVHPDAIMGAGAAAICTPLLGPGLAALMSRRIWTEEKRESGLAALGMGMTGNTKAAIPFAAAHPLRVIPAIMFGWMIVATIAMPGGAGNHAPHGGPMVLPWLDPRLRYIMAILAAALVTAVTIKKTTESAINASREKA
jgi:fructose-specific phosphotransferase system IIC component